MKQEYFISVKHPEILRMTSNNFLLFKEIPGASRPLDGDWRAEGMCPRLSSCFQVQTCCPQVSTSQRWVHVCRAEYRAHAAYLAVLHHGRCVRLPALVFRSDRKDSFAVCMNIL